jgi:hypothetical protein
MPYSRLRSISSRLSRTIPRTDWGRRRSGMAFKSLAWKGGRHGGLPCLGPQPIIPCLCYLARPSTAVAPRCRQENADIAVTRRRTDADAPRFR